MKKFARLLTLALIMFAAVSAHAQKTSLIQDQSGFGLSYDLTGISLHETDLAFSGLHLIKIQYLTGKLNENGKVPVSYYFNPEVGLGFSAQTLGEDDLDVNMEFTLQALAGVKVGFHQKLTEKLRLVPYHTYGFGIHYSSIEQGDSVKAQIADEFGFGFARKSAGAIQLLTDKKAGIELGYEQMLYTDDDFKVPALLVSTVIDAVYVTAVDFISYYFIAEYLSPEITPWAHFVLTNGYFLLINSVKSEDGEWPFDSPAPLMLTSFKIGISITL